MSAPHDAVRRSLARARDRELGEFLLRKHVVTSEQFVQALEGDESIPFGDRLGLAREELLLHLEEFAQGELDRVSRKGSSRVPLDVEEARRNPDRCVGGFILVERLGEGGAAQVWKAWDLAAHRWVAVKMIQGIARGEAADRWHREALASGRLAHPNIVPVHAVGEKDGQAWIAMALIEGTTLADVSVTIPEAIRILKTVARAVQHAHEKGVVHRDLKPANLLLDSSGTPWICDFGIALVADATRLTVPGTVLGTAPYLPPERAAGREPRRPESLDVYSLGATLYDLVTGEAPYDGRDFLEIVKKVEHEEPRPPSAVRPDLPKGLEPIILKAMARDPNRRYATAAAFADDLERLEQGRPVRARKPSRILRYLPAAAVALLVLGAATWGIPRLSRKPPGTDLLGLLESARTDLDRVEQALYDAAIPFEAYHEALDQARARVQEALSANPDHALALYRQGEIQETEGRFVEAQASWERAIAKDPTFAAAHHRLSRVLLAQAYLARLNLWSESEGAIRAESERLVRSGAGHLEAARTGGSAIRDDLPSALGKAMLAYLQERRDEAAAICESGLVEFRGRRGSEDFHWLLGLLQTAPAAAHDRYRRALEARPRHALVRFSRGILSSNEGQRDSSLADFDEALRISPGFGEARLYRGSSRAFAEDGDGALRDFEMLLQDPRLAPGAFNGRGFVRRKLLKDLDGAIADFSEAIRQRPETYHLAYVYRAEARLDRKDYEGAAADARRSYAIQPWGWTMTLLLQAYAGLRDWKGAERALDDLRIPADDEARRTLASLRGGR